MYIGKILANQFWYPNSSLFFHTQKNLQAYIIIHNQLPQGDLHWTLSFNLQEVYKRGMGRTENEATESLMEKEKQRPCSCATQPSSNVTTMLSTMYQCVFFSSHHFRMRKHIQSYVQMLKKPRKHVCHGSMLIFSSLKENNSLINKLKCRRQHKFSWKAAGQCAWSTTA